jgi:hypothetical protein
MTKTTLAPCVPHNTTTDDLATVCSLIETGGKAKSMTAGKQPPLGGVPNNAWSPTYPTWEQPLLPVDEYDRNYLAALRSGEVLAYTDDPAPGQVSLESCVFLGYINSLLADAKKQGKHTREITLSDLRKALPFFSAGQIFEYLLEWQHREDGVVFSIQPASGENDRAGLITIGYRNAQSRLQHLPIDRAVRVKDNSDYGISEAACLFYLATAGVRSPGHWVDIIAFGATPRHLPDQLKNLIRYGAVKQHRKHGQFVRVTNASRTLLPEVLWFYSKRFTLALSEARA